MDIVIDFDGTVVSHEFPKVGNDIGAVPVLKELVRKGHKLILFTMRSNIENPKSENPLIVLESGNYLDDAIEWFKKHDIPLFGIQTNPTQSSWTSSPKAYGQIIIDDAALGCPLSFNIDISQRPYVDWSTVKMHLKNRNII